MTKKSKEKKQSKEEIKNENVKNTEETSKNAANASDNEEPATCEEDIQSLEDQIADHKDKYLRLFSEFDNYKKRTTKERIELFKTATSDLMIDLLPVMDDFDRALESFAKTSDVEAIKEGVQHIYNKFKSTLEKKGLKSMDSEGKDFDTDYHEAITEIPAPTEELKSKVVHVAEKGYTLNDKVIRFAKVVVGK